MGLEFPTNLLIFGKSSSKIFLAEIEETVLESIFSLETISFFEIVRAVGVLEEVLKKQLCLKLKEQTPLNRQNFGVKVLWTIKVNSEQWLWIVIGEQ